MKLIFLDIDGVLNNEDWYRYRAKDAYLLTNNSDIKAYNFDPDNWKWIEKLIQETDAKIVISSSWRSYSLKSTIDDFVNTAFEPMIKYIIGVTPYSFERHRGREIETFLNTTDLEIENYVIIDDDTDMLTHQLPHFVNVCYTNGMTENDYKKAKEILK